MEEFKMLTAVQASSMCSAMSGREMQLLMGLTRV